MTERTGSFPPVLWVAGALLLVVYGIALSRNLTLPPAKAVTAPPSNPPPAPLMEDFS